jgi:ComF family protein
MKRIAAAFDYDGPAATLVKQLKYGGQPYLAEGAGSFLTAQFIRLEWPLPDFIIPMPMAPLRRFERGYNQSQLLAEVIGRLINRPVLNILKRASGDFSQAGLSHKQRLQLSENAITLKSNEQLRDACLLLVDDVMTTGSTLQRCAKALAGGYPESIYAITVCRAIYAPQGNKIEK